MMLGSTSDVAERIDR